MINLYDILQEILTETVTPQDVNDAINNKIQVIINYSDEKNRAPNKRLIEPYAYGITKKGNSVLRAYQYEGDTFRGKPKWKFFRLDRIKNWEPTGQHFNAQPNERGWNAEEYNENGDKTMETVLNQVKFDYDETSNNPYEKGSKPYQIRKQTDNLKQSTPIKNTKINEPGPIITKNAPKTKNDAFNDMLKRNLEITRKEKEKRGFSLSNKNINKNKIENDNIEEIPQLNNDVNIYNDGDNK